jgi:ADP-ribosylglycohydrolase
MANSTDFEDAIRNAVSLGGDSDTIACITGGIAQAHYGVPPTIANRALSFLDPDLKHITTQFHSRYC